MQKLSDSFDLHIEQFSRTSVKNEEKNETMQNFISAKAFFSKIKILNPEVDTRVAMFCLGRLRF